MPRNAIASVDELEATTFSGRRFTREQLQQVIRTVGAFQNLSLKELALTVCEHFSWSNAGGALKVNSCLTLLKNLAARGLVTLPAKRITKKPKSRRVVVSEASNAKPTIRCSLENVGRIELRLVSSGEDLRLFNELVERHHYLGYRQPVGQSLRYFIVAKGLEEEKLGCLLFAPAAFGMKARDEWIGWKRHHRVKRLALVISNKRFLIFPWVEVPNLASKALSLIPSQVGADWHRIHGTLPVLIETFINPAKFAGTCYQAANWQFIGQTNRCSRYGESRGDRSPKDIYVHPLDQDFRAVLRGKKLWPPREDAKPTTILVRQSLSAADQGFADLWTKIIAELTDIARKFDDTWQKRKRVVDSLILVLLIFRLVGSKDRRGYGSVIDEVWDNCDKMKIALPQRDSIAISTFGDARLKLDESIFKIINARMIAIYEEEYVADHRWHDRRVFAVDGTKLNLPRAMRKNGYGLPTPSAHYPQGLGSCLYNVKTMMPHDFGLYSCKDERRCAREHLETLLSGDVVVYDRGYFSYAMLHRHHTTGIHAIFRLKKSQYAEIRAFWRSDETDKVVAILPEGPTRKQIERNNPGLEIKPLKLRLIKYHIDKKAYCLGTTLLDENVGVKDFQDAYHARWGVEELYKISKQTFAIEQFHGRTERGVKQELFAHFALITMNRIIAHHANRTRQDPEPRPGSRAPALRQTNLKNAVGTFYCYLESLILCGASFTNSIARVIKNTVKRSLPVRLGRAFPRISYKAIGKWVPAPQRLAKGRGSRRRSAVAAVP